MGYLIVQIHYEMLYKMKLGRYSAGMGWRNRKDERFKKPFLLQHAGKYTKQERDSVGRELGYQGLRGVLRARGKTKLEPV